MPLKGLLYRKLKELAKTAEKKPQGPARLKEDKKSIFNNIKTKNFSPMPAPIKAAAAPQEQKRDILKGAARYWGGHFLYPIKTVELGELAVNKNSIQFVKYGLLKRPEWNIEIPLNKVEWKKVGQIVEEEGYYNITCFTIPFTDDKGVRHQPKFSVENSAAREQFSKFLYQKMSRRGAQAQ